LKQHAKLKDSDDDLSWNLDQVLQELKVALAELKEIQCQSWEKHDEGLHQCLQEEEEKSMDSWILMQLRRWLIRLRPSFGVSNSKPHTLESNRCSHPLPLMAASNDQTFQKLKMAKWYKVLMASLSERCSLR
jgi:hypothetical protein